MVILFVGNAWGKHMFQDIPWSNALCAAFLGYNTALQENHIFNSYCCFFCGSLFTAHNEGIIIKLYI